MSLRVGRSGWQSWRSAMQLALYGEAGFYRSSGAPGRHFRTSAHTTALWADAITELARRVDAELGEPPEFTVVDAGAGGGELLRALDERAPERWQLVGVDVAARPDALPPRVTWSAQPPDRVTGLLLAVELLDVVPLDVVESTDAGPRLVEVALDGEERLAGPLEATQLAWLDRWWPLADLGDRAEIGLTRDDAWQQLTASLVAGLAVAVDYAADPTRDVAGTLTGFRDGRQIAPVPDGSCDLTAHVRFASLARPGDLVLTQRQALRLLGVDGRRPAYDGNPAAYLAELSRAGEAAELLDPGGLGGFTWLLHPATPG